MAPQVDRALEELPEETRLVLIQHYLEGRSQKEIAAERGVGQSTVSRQIANGIAGLRTKLKKAGVVATVGALAVLLAQNALQKSKRNAWQVEPKVLAGMFGESVLWTVPLIGASMEVWSCGCLVSVNLSICGSVNPWYLSFCRADLSSSFSKSPDEPPVRARSADRYSC